MKGGKEITARHQQEQGVLWNGGDLNPLADVKEESLLSQGFGENICNNTATSTDRRSQQDLGEIISDGALRQTALQLPQELGSHSNRYICVGFQTSVSI